MAKIVILGAGLTGISTAYHLEKLGYYDYKIFEKEDTPGGLCRSVVQDGFTFDFTGHLLHISDDYFKSLISSLVALESFNPIKRRSYIYSHNTYTHYPFQVNLHGLPVDVIVECIEGFLTRKKVNVKPTMFTQWVLRQFGAGFAHHFFYPYQTKIFAYDVHKLSASWTGRFVPSTSLRQIVEGALQEPHNQAIGYNASFLYPKKGGIYFWVEKLAQQLLNPVHANFCVRSIDTIQKVVHFTNGHVEPYDQLISTLPLDLMLNLMREKSSVNLARASSKLLCNKVVNFNLGINRADLSDKHWIYYPESQYPFYRIGFPHNFSDSMTPPNCSSLYGEFSYLKETQEVIESKLARSLQATKKLFSIADTQVMTEKIISINHAYVIYDLWREKNLPLIHKKLHELDIFSVGRYGEWKYSSMQEGVLDGKAIAEKLVIIPAHQVPIEQPLPQQPLKHKELSL